MLDTLSRNIIYGKTHYAIEHIGEDESILILQVKDQKGELNITETTTVDTIDKVKEQLSKLKSAHLIINNNQVLQKTVISDTTRADIELLNSAFSNIDVKVFYYEIVRSAGKAFVSICRKEYVHSLIQSYRDKNVFITAWSLGNSPLDSLIPMLDGQGTIVTASSAVAYKNGYKDAIHHNANHQDVQASFQIDGLEVQGNQMNALGAVLRNLGGVDEDRYCSNYNEDQEDKQSLFKQHRFYELGLPAAVGILLLVFLVNFLFYNYYYQEVSVLGEISESNTLQKELLVKKDGIVDQKQKLFEDVIESSSSSSSFYIDQVVQEMPQTISLEQLQYHPLLKKIRKGKSIALENDIISISGVAKVNSDISYWISIIEDKDFVNKVSIKNLENKGSNTLFTIEVQTK